MSRCLEGACSDQKCRYGTGIVRGVSRPAKTRLGAGGKGICEETDSTDFSMILNGEKRQGSLWVGNSLKKTS